MPFYFHSFLPLSLTVKNVPKYFIELLTETKIFNELVESKQSVKHLKSDKLQDLRSHVDAQFYLTEIISEDGEPVVPNVCATGQLRIEY